MCSLLNPVKLIFCISLYKAYVQHLEWPNYCLFHIFQWGCLHKEKCINQFFHIHHVIIMIVTCYRPTWHWSVHSMVYIFYNFDLSDVILQERQFSDIYTSLLTAKWSDHHLLQQEDMCSDMGVRRLTLSSGYHIPELDANLLCCALVNLGNQLTLVVTVNFITDWLVYSSLYRRYMIKEYLE